MLIDLELRERLALKAQFIVNPMCPLDVDLPTLATQGRIDEARAGAKTGDLARRHGVWEARLYNRRRPNKASIPEALARRRARRLRRVRPSSRPHRSGAAA